jgi:hypothetical protein
MREIAKERNVVKCARYDLINFENFVYFIYFSITHGKLMTVEKRVLILSGVY